MTLINLVNHVLRRLRESEVSDVMDTEYSKMICDFVNDAKRICENAHQWNALFGELELTTAASTQTLTLDGLGQAGQVLDMINDTSNLRMIQAHTKWMNDQTNFTGTQEGPPRWFAFNGVAADDDPIVDLWPIPDTTYTIKVKYKLGSERLENSSDELAIPEDPVIQYAFAFALRERGEVGGSNYNEQLQIAKTMLSDYIAIDAERRPEDQTWDAGYYHRTLRNTRWIIH